MSTELQQPPQTDIASLENPVNVQQLLSSHHMHRAYEHLAEGSALIGISAVVTKVGFETLGSQPESYRLGGLMLFGAGIVCGSAGKSFKNAFNSWRRSRNPMQASLIDISA